MHVFVKIIRLRHSIDVNEVGFIKVLCIGGVVGEGEGGGRGEGEEGEGFPRNRNVSQRFTHNCHNN